MPQGGGGRGIKKQPVSSRVAGGVFSGDDPGVVKVVENPLD